MAEIKYPNESIERITATYCNANHERLFLMTYKPQAGVYFLYKFTPDGLVKLGKSRSPIELEEKFEVRKMMGC